LRVVDASPASDASASHPVLVVNDDTVVTDSTFSEVPGTSSAPDSELEELSRRFIPLPHGSARVNIISLGTDNLSTLLPQVVSSPLYPDGVPLDKIIGPPPFPVTWTVAGTDLDGMADTGSQCDILHPKRVLSLGLPLLRLQEPIQLDLATQGHADRALFATMVDFMTKDHSFPGRLFLVAPLGGNLDFILGTPFFRDTGLAAALSRKLPKGLCLSCLSLDTGAM
jgi:hypothetical protein